MAAPLHLSWGADALRRQLAALLPGLDVEVVASIGSTNTELLERARRAGQPAGAQRNADPAPAVPAPARRLSDHPPCLLVAEHQTRGRGRQGKDWQSSPGASLTCSLALPLAPADWSGLSLAVGLALAEALDPPRPDAPPRLLLKWPNDLLLRDPDSAPDSAPARPGRKLGGILIETLQSGDRRIAVVGVGLNLQPQAESQDSAALSWGQACLQELRPGIDPPAALALIAAPLLQALLDFERTGFAGLRQRYAARDALAGRWVETSLAGLPGGWADGVDASGTLWLRVPDGAGERRLPVGSGEVSLRSGSAGPRPC